MQAIDFCFRPVCFSSTWFRSIGAKAALFSLTKVTCLLRRHLLLLSGVFLLSSCSTKSAPQPRAITLQQQWTLNPGDEIAGTPITGSLGDVSLYLDGKGIYAPFKGEVEASEQAGCVLYSMPEVPAYLFRLCGLDQINYGSLKARQPIGKGKHISFATLRRQPDGTWVIVEPAKDVLEKALLN